MKFRSSLVCLLRSHWGRVNGLVFSIGCALFSQNFPGEGKYLSSPLLYHGRPQILGGKKRERLVMNPGGTPNPRHLLESLCSEPSLPSILRTNELYPFLVLLRKHIRAQVSGIDVPLGKKCRFL